MNSEFPTVARFECGCCGNFHFQKQLLIIIYIQQTNALIAIAINFRHGQTPGSTSAKPSCFSPGSCSCLGKQRFVTYRICHKKKTLANEQQFRHVFFVHQIKNCCNHDSNSTVTPGLANSNRYLSLFFALSFASSQNKLIETKIVWTKIMNLCAVPVTPYRSCLRLPFLLNPLGDQRSLNRRIPKANGSLLPCLFRDHVGEPNHGDTC